MKKNLLVAVLALGLARGTQAAPETTKVRLGFIALTDCAPLVIAKVKGLFAKHGMPDVELIKQASWGSTRDNLELGSERGGIDGAHILTPMVYAMHLGLVTQGRVPLPMAILCRLNVNGQAISVGKAYEGLNLGLDATPLKAELERLRQRRKTLVGAMTFPTGTHNYWLRYWLAAAGIDPDTDLAILVVPPPQMVANLRVGTMDFFCVGEPWNQQTINQNLGYSCLTTGELWHDHPEKALGMRADWVKKHPQAAQALLQAVMEAQIWCDKDANKEELARILSEKSWVNCRVEDILPRLKGSYELGPVGRGRMADAKWRMTFFDRHASFPYKSHDKWFLAETRRWGFLPHGVDYDKVVGEVNRADIWRKAAKQLGLPASQIPKTDSRGKETFFDGVVFDPADPEGYLAKLKLKNIAGKKSGSQIR
jgi:nitrate/nitrite transport system substrate-binding protein